MNTVYTTQAQGTHIEIGNTIISMGRWEFFLYLAIAFLIGYLVHYIFSSRRDYVRAPRGHRYYSHSEPVYPARY